MNLIKYVLMNLRELIKRISNHNKLLSSYNLFLFNFDVFYSYSFKDGFNTITKHSIFKIKLC